ncbi:uncharacterized protein BJ212DRAFT_1284977 [Suillus subaureus]|uniref:Hydrophobin n=1 Tax=Suillus subaureus TaxID=48587 RepID=A0A9P7J4Z7_9AGAM|nr:uncharacterized protein BJ212DRAFT_1284977 [Suillus subaureus]KAG1803478.1 hypothetical protein BJ212DRAFT_1284977 [Suillus subaureus]
MLKRIVALLSLTILVVANDSQCDTGTIMCCDTKSTYPQTEPTLTELGLVDIAAVVDAFVALSCSGISVVGTSNGCTANQEPLCCENEKYNGAVNIGCTPINVGL